MRCSGLPRRRISRPTGNVMHDLSEPWRSGPAKLACPRALRSAPSVSIHRPWWKRRAILLRSHARGEITAVIYTGRMIHLFTPGRRSPHHDQTRSEVVLLPISSLVGSCGRPGIRRGPDAPSTRKFTLASEARDGGAPPPDWHSRHPCVSSRPSLSSSHHADRLDARAGQTCGSCPRSTATSLQSSAPS